MASERAAEPTKADKVAKVAKTDKADKVAKVDKAKAAKPSDVGHPRWVRIGAISAAAVLVLATGYIAVVAVLWSQHVESLRAEADDLNAERASLIAEAEEREAALNEADGGLDEAQLDLLVTANRAVQADDYALYFSYIGRALTQCADVSVDITYYVRRKHSYVRWQWPDMREWGNDTREICMEIRDYYDYAVEDYVAEVEFVDDEGGEE